MGLYLGAFAHNFPPQFFHFFIFWRIQFSPADIYQSLPRRSGGHMKSLMWLADWLLSSQAEKGARPQSILTARTGHLWCGREGVSKGERAC